MESPLQCEISKDVQKAIQYLMQDELIGLPTETVYGLAGNAFSTKAVQAIYDTKQRPHNNPLIVHVANVDAAKALCTQFPIQAEQLAAAFWPGPLTMILPKQAMVPDLVTAGHNTVAIRIPEHALALELIHQLPFPLAAPSANPFKRISPTTAQHVADYFPQTLKMVLDGGPCLKGIESTIVGFDDDAVIIYRPGNITEQDIERVTGSRVVFYEKKDDRLIAPGMMAQHYAPQTPLIFTNDWRAEMLRHPGKKIGLLSLSKQEDFDVTKQEVLSVHDALEEVTANLYAALHRLDVAGLDILIAEAFEEKGLGKSLNDRLRRAATR
jgi:L-threonylcarbamoyladenylate synthase